MHLRIVLARRALVSFVAFVSCVAFAAGCGGEIREEPGDGSAAATSPSSSADAAAAAAAATAAAAPSAASAADPFRPGDDWRGTYTCAQGVTNLDLRIVSMHGDTIDDAVFEFDWTSGGVQGSYHLTGTFDPATGNATFVPGAWIDDPGTTSGSTGWYTVGMTGAADAHAYTGSITNDACGAFSLTKV